MTPNTEPHRLKGFYLQRAINVHVVGAGGNGAQFVNGLARMHMSLLALGHPHGFNVTLFDSDVVTEANIGRQLFSHGDVGQPKAHVIINRLNHFYALNWRAVAHRWHTAPPDHNRDSERHHCHFVVGCVDSAASRRQIESHAGQVGADYWLDMGNEAKTGQVILGEVLGAWTRKGRRYWEYDEDRDKTKKRAPRLPTVMDLYKQLRNPKLKEDDTPSCSLAGALERQDLFINQTVATFALNLLWRFFRTGALDIHGYFINLESGVVNALAVDPVGWERFNYFAHTLPPLRAIRKVIDPIRPFHRGEFLLVCGHQAKGFGMKKIRCLQCQQEGRQ